MGSLKTITKQFTAFGPRGGLYLCFELECGHDASRSLTKQEKRNHAYCRPPSEQKRAKCHDCASEVADG